MSYLIDGNNVMDQAGTLDQDLSFARKRLINELVRFVAARRVKIRVVFDGIPEEDFPEGRSYKSVKILYARPGSDADSRIKDIIRKSSYKRDMTLVSSDRELGGFARRQGTRVISAGQFRSMLRETSEQTDTVGDTCCPEPVNVDEWLDFFEKPKKP
jgi:predicted RNA-binding protein with PIN domain